MTTAAAIIQFSVVSLLALAALHKLANLPNFAATLDLLGVPAVAARRMAWAVTIIKLGTAGSIGFEPGVVQGMIVAGLGLAFAGAGGLALHRGVRVRCACLGAGWHWRGGPTAPGRRIGADDALLGRRQLIACYGVW